MTDKIGEQSDHFTIKAGPSANRRYLLAQWQHFRPMNDGPLVKISTTGEDTTVLTKSHGTVKHWCMFGVTVLVLSFEMSYL